MPTPSRPWISNERSQSTWLSSAVICAASAVACSDFKPETDTFSDTLPVAPADGPDWSCLKPEGNESPPLPGSAGEDVFYILKLVDLATDLPMAAAEVRACGLTDLGCTQEITGWISANDQGYVTVPLTSNFDGFLEIKKNGWVPYTFRLPPTGLRTMRDFPLAMIAVDSFSELLRAFKLEGNQDLGSIGVRAFDCRGNPAPGVKLSSDAGSIAWYFAGGAPDVMRTTTDKEGLGGFIGSEAGLKFLDAELADGRAIVSDMRIIVRPLWMAAGYLKANPMAPMDE